MQAKSGDKFEWGTKAQTLAALRGRVTRSRISDLRMITWEDWSRAPSDCLNTIREWLPFGRVILRSSADAEDSAEESKAGQFISLGDVAVRDTAGLTGAVNRVFDSYPERAARAHVLVQPMLMGLSLAGVAFTREPQTGAPYILISYDDESGRTDTVTGGINVNKAVIVWRGAPARMVTSDRIRKLLDALAEIETLTGSDALDVELALDINGAVYILQVRPITARRDWDPARSSKLDRILKQVETLIEHRRQPGPSLAGTAPVYGEMTDWNPAEMIGTCPSPLAYSLYRDLITRQVWRSSRALMGYYDPPGEELMVDFAGRPFIDVRNSFNSFTPDDLPHDLRHLLVDAWLDRLRACPELHDKVEFDVALTTHHPGFRTLLEERYPGLLTTAQADLFEAAAKRILERAVTADETVPGSLTWARDKVRRLRDVQKQRGLGRAPAVAPPDLPALIATLCDECRRLGTLPFSVAARHAFMAEMLMRALVHQGAVDPQTIDRFKAGIRTVAGDVVGNLTAVRNGTQSPETFLNEYGHLRPGTYDITSIRYDRLPDLFSPPGNIPSAASLTPRDPSAAALPPEALARVDACLAAEGYTFSARQLFPYLADSIRAREGFKHIFTRHVSDILELVARLGEVNGLSRTDMALLPIERIYRLRSGAFHRDQALRQSIRADIAEAERRQRDRDGMQLSYLVRERDDLYVIPCHRSRPNFITSRTARAAGRYLDAGAGVTADLAGKIVLIENADPGFDWIFAAGIAALVTKFGGANSHMAIRCREFSMPAAIGCGQQTFARLVAADCIELDCEAETVRPVL